MSLSRILGAVLLPSFLAGCGPSLGALHERAAVGALQENAPVHAHQSVVVHAPRAKVWAVLSDVERWPTWQPSVTHVTPPRALAPEAAFGFTSGGSAIESKLALVRPEEALAWTGQVATAKAIHVWRLSSPTPDTTLVEDEETMDGFLLTWFYGQADLDRDMGRSLEELRRAAEAL